MTIATIRYIYCDGPLCSDDDEPMRIDPDPDQTIAETRARAKEYGWVQRGKRDLCPHCVAARSTQGGGS